MKQLTDNEFEIIVNRYYKLLVNVANKYLRNAFDSEDVVQNTFIKLYRARKEFDSDEHLKNWLIRVTVNNSLDFLKHHNCKKVLIDNEYINSLPDTSDAEEKNEDIRECVLSLKTSYKTIIILYYYEKYNLKDIACILKISESNASSRLDRARKKLKKILIERRKLND